MIEILFVIIGLLPVGISLLMIFPKNSQIDDSI